MARTKQQDQLGLVWAEKRPREYAQPIADKLKAVIKAELESVPKELRVMVTDEAISWLAMDFNLWKAKAGRK